MSLIPTEKLTTKLGMDLPAWRYDAQTKSIQCDFRFQNYYETIAFVNAVAFIANQMNHHPDLTVKYQTCHVLYSTHDAGGVTEKDLAAAKAVQSLCNIA